MTEKTTSNRTLTELLKDSLMVIVTLIFVLLYAAAFTGKFDPLKDNTMLLRLEPIIFILIGYYFGRHPSRQNEKLLKEELQHQTSRADAAQFAKEKAQIERETLEEKRKNARTALKTIAPDSAKAVKGILDS